MKATAILTCLLITACDGMPGMPTQETPKPPSDDCVLYSKAANGATIKIASVGRPDLVGGTEADRAVFKKDRKDYDAMWSCVSLADKNGNWCECPRRASKSFEDMTAKANGKIIWIDRDKDGGQ
jgi:hypothetical protein